LHVLCRHIGAQMETEWSVLMAVLTLAWLLAFGARWGWLRWKKREQQERVYDFPADEFDALVRNWRRLTNRQLAWWVGGALWCALHGLCMLLRLDGWLHAFAGVDALGLIAITSLRARKSKRLGYSLLVSGHRTRFLLACLLAWLLALLWLALEHALVLGGEACNLALDCYSAYPLLWTYPLQNWPVAASLTVLALQVLVWLLALIMRYQFSARMGEENSRATSRLLRSLQLSLPLLWLSGLFLPLQWRFLLSTLVALVGLQLLSLVVRFTLARPIDSLEQRLRDNEPFRRWLRTAALRH